MQPDGSRLLEAAGFFKAVGLSRLILKCRNSPERGVNFPGASEKQWEVSVGFRKNQTKPTQNLKLKR